VRTVRSLVGWGPSAPKLSGLPRSARGVAAIPRSLPFETQEQIKRYFNGATIECLMCGRRFRRLGNHLAAIHGIGVDDYRYRFGLPWSRGLTSAASRTKSGWNAERKEKAREIAQKSRFFDFARLSGRREPPPSIKTQAVQNLGQHALGFGEAFDAAVIRLFQNGLTDSAIARLLNVERHTVAKRTRQWRRRKLKYCKGK
jgi:hypothetical protein